MQTNILTMLKKHRSATARRLMNELAAQDTPFLFAVNYKGTETIVLPLDELSEQECLYNFEGMGNLDTPLSPSRLAEVKWHVEKPDFEAYSRAFTRVQKAIAAGKTRLVNLTCQVPFFCDLTPRELYMATQAKYRLWIRDTLLCFSPETFLRIEHGEIKSYPMKGTIRADVPEAEAVLLGNEKEAEEHASVVELIKQDLGKVASRLEVRRYRYVDTLQTSNGPILETSSEVVGQLPKDYRAHLGDILFSQLPGGSITGMPKLESIKVISSAEEYNRGFYTGVMGLYADGKLNSAVMIRFIDCSSKQLYYKAGGGITAKSDCLSEYNEVITKCYVPLR